MLDFYYIHQLPIHHVHVHVDGQLIK